MFVGGNPFIFYPNQIPPLQPVSPVSETKKSKQVHIYCEDGGDDDGDRDMRFYDENGIEEFV
jgi:hypothetical protein